MLQTIGKLRDHTRAVEVHLPVMSFHSHCEILQIKHYIKTYYEPLLTDIEIRKLDQDYVAQMETTEELVEKRDITSPRKHICSKVQATLRSSQDDLPKRT